MGSPVRATREAVEKALRDLNAAEPRVFIDRRGRLIGARILAERVGGHQSLLRAYVTDLQEVVEPGRLPADVVQIARQRIQKVHGGRRAEMRSAHGASLPDRKLDQPVLHSFVADPASTERLDRIERRLESLLLLTETAISGLVSPSQRSAGEAHRPAHRDEVDDYNRSPTSRASAPPVQHGSAVTSSGKEAARDGGRDRSRISVGDLPLPSTLFAVDGEG